MLSKIYAQSLSAFVFLIAVGVKKTDCLPRYSLPLLLQHPHHSPVPVSPVHHFNFVSNGHPYKITVNNKELAPKLTKPVTTSKPNKPHKKPTNSPITWITSPLGFNGIPVNIISYRHQPHVNRIWGAPSGILTYYG